MQALSSFHSACISSLLLSSNLNFYNILGETWCHIKDLKSNVSFLSGSILKGVCTFLLMALGKKLGTNAEVCLVDYKVDAPIEICSRKYPRKSFLDYSFAPRRASAFVLLVSLSSVPGTSSRYCDSWQESNMCR